MLLARYGTVPRRGAVTDFEGLRQEKRAREDDERRGWRYRPRGGGGSPFNRFTIVRQARHD